MSLLFVLVLAESDDPITAILNKDWAALGGWSLFITLVVFIVLGAFKGWWIPGWMYKAQGETLKEAMEQNTTLLVSAKVATHFFEATTPSREDQQ